MAVAARVGAGRADRQALDRSGHKSPGFVLRSRHEAPASRPRCSARHRRPRRGAEEGDPASARSYHHAAFGRHSPCPARDRRQIHAAHARPTPVCCPATQELPRVQDRSALGPAGGQCIAMLRAALRRGSCRALRSHHSRQAALAKCPGSRPKRVYTLAANPVTDVAEQYLGEVASVSSLIDGSFS